MREKVQRPHYLSNFYAHWTTVIYGGGRREAPQVRSCCLATLLLSLRSECHPTGTGFSSFFVLPDSLASFFVCFVSSQNTGEILEWSCCLTSNLCTFLLWMNLFFIVIQILIRKREIKDESFSYCCFYCRSSKKFCDHSLIGILIQIKTSKFLFHFYICNLQFLCMW